MPEPRQGQIQHTIEAVLRDGQQPLILDAGTHDGRSACWLAQHWPGASACHQVLQRLPERSDAVYLGFPWASLIDHLNNGTSRGRALLRQLQSLVPLIDGKARRFTVCQQIFFQQHRWLFELAGITDLF